MLAKRCARQQDRLAGVTSRQAASTKLLPTEAAVLLLLLLLVNGYCVATCMPLLVVPYSCTFSKPRCCPVVCGAHV